MEKRFLFVTANENETRALLEDKDFFSYKDDKRSSDPDDDSFYNVGMFGKYEAVHFQLQDQGSILAGASLQTIYLAINYWQPDAVILVGISFGKDNEQKPEPRQHIGDVLISKMIQDYESGKIKEGKHQSDGPKPEAGKTLVSVFQNYARSWRYDIKGRQANCHFGLLLSGDKVVDDVEFKKALFTAYPRAIGGEMEGRGAYSACRSKKLSEWIIIKAICDWGENKENPNKEADQLTAARSVVDFMKHVFSIDNAFDKLPQNGHKSQGTPKDTNKPPISTPLGYFINIGTTSCRLFEVINKHTIKEVFVTSYEICDTQKDSYLDGIIATVKNKLLPKMQGSKLQPLQKIFVDYKFSEIFNQYEDPKVQKDFIRDFYKETNLYFNILSKTQTIENLKRRFSGILDKTAIINISSHSVDVMVYSGGDFVMYSLSLTLADVKFFVEKENIAEIWDTLTVDKIKKYISEKIGSALNDINVQCAFILKDELRFMRETGYPLKYMTDGNVGLTHLRYKDANYKYLFSVDYKSKLDSQYHDDDTTINRLYGFKYGHIVIEAILDLMNNRQVIPCDDLSIHGSINAYIFNVVISGSTHGDGTAYIIEAHKIMDRMGVAVLSPQVTEDGQLLAKEITPETEYDHLQAIDECDVLFICNKRNGGYIGESTKCEIYYAYALRKTIAFWEKPPDDKRLSFIPKEHWGTIKSLVI